MQHTTTNQTTNPTTTKEETTMQPTHETAAEAHRAAAAAWQAVVDAQQAGKGTKRKQAAAEAIATDAAWQSEALVDAGWNGTDGDGERTDTMAIRSAEEAARKHAEAAEEHEAAAQEEDTPSRRMAATLDRYKPQYQTAIAYSGNATQNNGDALATLLGGCTPEEICALADRVLGTEPGFHVERYARLNPGQRRMNSGNKIRAAWKRGDTTVEAIAALLA